jgi:serine phosphatase RsbU (regulator of sigma subunit)
LAGHPVPLLLCGSRIHEMDVESEPPLGIAADIHWTGQTVELGKAWSMLCYTDGLTEGFDDGPSRLGVDGLLELLASRDPDEDVDYFVDTLIKDVVARNGGALADDVAILHLSRRSRGR